MSETVIMAYSGGLDTIISLDYLKQKGYKVIAVLAHLGQKQYLEQTGERALSLGVSGVHITDLRQRFIRDYIFPTLKAQARYESEYLLCAALSRPLIAEELVRVANEENSSIIAHGGRGGGNERIRFEKAVSSLAPHIRILAPVKELNLKSVREDLAYARKHNLPLERVKYTIYNMEENLWGVNIQLNIDHISGEPPGDTYLITTPLAETDDKPTVLEIGFRSGIPTVLNGKKTAPVELVNLLNKIGGKNAIGRSTMVENKISGEKSYGIYEAPAATILYTAHRALEEIILDKDLLHFKNILSQKYAELVYEGAWFSPVRQGLAQFFDYIQQPVTGSVKVKLYKGYITVTTRKTRNHR